MGLSQAQIDDYRDFNRYSAMENERVSHELYLLIEQAIEAAPEIDMSYVWGKQWNRMAEHNEARRLLVRAKQKLEGFYGGDE